jgi:hypothetical protein
VVGQGRVRFEAMKTDTVLIPALMPNGHSITGR